MSPVSRIPRRPARVVVLCGPARSGKTERLLARYRVAFMPPPGAVLWSAPTWRAAAEVRQRLFDGTFAGCFSPGVMTFEKFAEAVLHAAGVPLRPITRLMKRELVRQIVSAQSARGRLRHFQPIAATGGLVDLVCEFIGELKRLEIWPEEFHRACTAHGISDKDVELFEIYDAYQQSLREHGLFDAEGRFWSARDVLARGEGRGAGEERNDECGMMNDESTGAKRGVADALVVHRSSFIIHHWQLVIVDGFTDFTRTQHEIIEILAARAEETVITLPLESEPRRADLFAKPLKTLAELRRRHGDGLVVEELPRPSQPEWSAMAHLERTLFANPRGARDEGRGTGDERKAEESLPSPIPNPQSLIPPSSAGIEILAAARQAGEIELIAARIKRLLVDGLARPGEIALVFRLPQEVGGLVTEIFDRLGIPVVFESGQALDRAPALRALVALLQLDLDDWPFDQLLAALGSNYLWPDGPGWKGNGRAAAEVERTIRELQIPRGRGRLIEQLSGCQKVACGAGVSPARAADHRSAAVPAAAPQITKALVSRLAAALDALPQQATLPDWAEAWQRLAEETGLMRAIEEGKGEGGGGKVAEASSALLSDRLAWNRLMAVLAAGDTLAGWLARRPPELDRRAAFEALLDVLRSERVGHGGDESGYVRVLSAASVRSLRIPYLFLAGLSEKVFPPPDREDRLYGEAEYLRLIDAGLPLTARTERTRDEMLLFYEAITRATTRLYLSYPAIDESAQPLLPSPFLNEVEQAFGRGRIPRVERTDLRPIPRDDEPLSNAEFRIKAMATALEGNVALLAGLMQGIEGIEGEGERGRGRGGKGTRRRSRVLNR